MGATALLPIMPKLAKLLPLLSSDQPGEVMATAAAIGRTLASAGLTWHDLTTALEPSPGIYPNPDHNDPLTLAERLWATAGMTEWEESFVGSVIGKMRQGRRLSEKQAETLRTIYGDRLGGAR